MTSSAAALSVLNHRDGRLRLLRADPHRWGAGLIHVIDEERDRTICGKAFTDCPGRELEGFSSQINCKLCIRSIETRICRKEESRKQEEYERQREEEKHRWWNQYDAYLLTPIWRDKRRRVLERAKQFCEGCGRGRAAQIHHLRYPQYPPGSREWIRQEKLFDLVALCNECHSDIHELSGRHQ